MQKVTSTFIIRYATSSYEAAKEFLGTSDFYSDSDILFWTSDKEIIVTELTQDIHRIEVIGD